jgi:hypothetical protein
MYLNVLLLFLSLFVFTGYLLFISVRYGRLESISASFYALPERHRYVFTLALWGFAMPVMMASTSAFQFLAGAGICFVGAAAAYKEELTSTVHYVGAVSAILLGLLYASIYVSLIYLIVWIVLFIIIQRLSGRRAVYWVEVVSYYVIITSLINSLI